VKGDVNCSVVYVLVGERKTQRDIRPYVKLLYHITQYAQVVCEFLLHVFCRIKRMFISYCENTPNLIVVVVFLAELHHSSLCCVIIC